MMKDAIKGWATCEVFGTKGFVLFSKVKDAKSRLKIWNISNKANFIHPNKVKEKLGIIDSKATVEGWTDTLKLERVQLLSDLWKSLRREEQLWKQKSRINWLMDGDKNTKFFHHFASYRRNKKHIWEVKDQNGATHSGQQAIKDEAINYFKSFFSETSQNVIED